MADIHAQRRQVLIEATASYRAPVSPIDAVIRARLHELALFGGRDAHVRAIELRAFRRSLTEKGLL